MACGVLYYARACTFSLRIDHVPRIFSGWSIPVAPNRLRISGAPRKRFAQTPTSRINSVWLGSFQGEGHVNLADGQIRAVDTLNEPSDNCRIRLKQDFDALGRRNPRTAARHRCSYLHLY